MENNESLKRKVIDDNTSDKETELKKIRIEDTKAVSTPNGNHTINAADFNRKRKVAILLAYCGASYHGMQKNPDVETIEKKLLEALAKINALPDGKVKSYLDQNDNQISFQRAARTDKGVSAARQVVSLKLVADESFIQNVNDNLPYDIRVFGIERTTRPFDSKASCSGRSYEYLLPSFAFASCKKEFSESYRISEEQLQIIRNFYAKFEGTHNFHNFTSGKRFTDKSAKRYITSFKPGKPFEKNGLEFIAVQIEGQSFMIHQIRKMIGVGIAHFRGYCEESFLEQCFLETKLDIPKAPGLGLLLNNLHFKQYDKKYGNDGLHNPLTFEYAQAKIEAFKDQCIYAAIIKEEIEKKAMITWLKTLSCHTFKEAGTSKADLEASQKKLEDDNVADPLSNEET